MKREFITIQNLIEILSTPIVPILCLFYFIHDYFLEQNILYFLLSVLILYILYKVILFIKRSSQTLFKITLLSTEWFVLDLLNVFSNDMFDLLKPSLLESSIKLGINYMI